MAKDDYYVIVARILTFLYAKLKGRENRGVMEYIRPETKDFPIAFDYMEYIISHMYSAELIERVFVICDPDGEPISAELTDETRITPEGIAYLEENSMIRKALKLVPAVTSFMKMG